MLFESAGIVLTNRCNARCDMCCFGCCPENTGVFTEEQLFCVIDQLAEHGIKHIGFTGGEVMLYPKLLNAGLSHARSLGFECAITSNGFWAKDYTKCEKVLKNFYDNRINYLAVSIDENHLKHISIDCHRNIIKANREIGLNLRFAIGDSLDKVSAIDIIRELGRDIYGQSLKMYPFFPVGRGGYMSCDKLALSDYEPKWNCCYQKHLAIFYDGTVMPCCSPAMSGNRLGNGNIFNNALAEIISDYEDCGCFSTLLRQGFEFFMQIAKKEGFEFGEKFVSPCHLCNVLFTNESFVSIVQPYVREEYARHAYDAFRQAMLKRDSALI